MNKDRGKLLSLLFNPEEEISVSPNQYAYRSIDQAALEGESVTLISNTSDDLVQVHTDAVAMVAINPISGRRADENCTAFRNFLVEIDTMALEDQLTYVNDKGLPFSACVFSGNKSYHFLVSLDRSLNDLELYRFYSEWILEALPEADQSTKNPSRSTRIPGIRRGAGFQKLEFCGERISLERLQVWLSNFQRKKKVYDDVDWNSNPDFKFVHLPVSARYQVVNGVDTTHGRNNGWFALAVDFGKVGCSLELMTKILEEKFVPEKDFSRKEWENALVSGHKFGVKKWRRG